MRYQKTHSDDIPELTRLWKQAFGDSDEDIDRKSTRLNSSHPSRSRMPSSA